MGSLNCIPGSAVDGKAAQRPDEIDAAALRSIESDLRHLVESKLPGYPPAVNALRNLQALMALHGVARNVAGEMTHAAGVKGGEQ